MDYSPGTLVRTTEQKEGIEYFRVVLIYIKYVSTMVQCNLYNKGQTTICLQDRDLRIFQPSFFFVAFWGGGGEGGEVIVDAA